MIKIIFISFALVLKVFALEISKQETFSVNIVPNTQASSFSLAILAQSTNEIERSFKRAISYANRSDICKGGQYRIYPEYEYKNNKKVEKGYNSRIDFDCEFQDIKEYEKLLTQMKRVDAKLTQNKIFYKVTDKENELQKSKLEADGYSYAKKYLKHLNTIFNRCSIKSIQFRDGNRPVHYRALASAKSTNTTSPIVEDVTIELRVDYLFECQN